MMDLLHDPAWAAIAVVASIMLNAGASYVAIRTGLARVETRMTEIHERQQRHGDRIGKLGERTAVAEGEIKVLRTDVTRNQADIRDLRTA